MTIAVDFDGTLADTDATKIYSPNTKLINYLIARRNNGDKIILSNPWQNASTSKRSESGG